MSDPSPFMQEALRLAASVRGRTSPNPWVGAVLVRDGVIIARGATAPYGGPHAEAAALAAAADAARGATLYCTLEPCVPFPGKRTPPCSDAIIAAGVRRVVVALLDPHVGGPGIERLRAAGIEVDIGDGAEAAAELLRPYLKWRQLGLPYVIAKFAVSLDGAVGAPAEGVTWLTGPAAVERVHRDRDRADAILVGSGTILADDPALTARPGGAPAERQPVRIVLDARGRTPPESRVFAPGGPVIVATAHGSPPAWRQALVGRGAALIELDRAEGRLELRQLLRALGQRNIQSLIVEGGPTVLASFFEADLVDEVHAYVSPRILGSAGIPLIPRGAAVPLLHLESVVIEPLPPDVLVRGYTGSWQPPLLPTLAPET
ncbi:bifunctional diaminohydroxyphosphoribosylaminopyrimidine deaminase/5-amino-6-(5-phosphoribosylamino)uracil reductase RibD [Tepidiforma flava]|uniref:Riboflavin biosynthesis protein RibD n=1 Tax=Tepidiforma flava TaxID=3004094 RepID=A0ABY7M996_9CHLR|nr:bifunctional diaminohydroxyphosphoribosylaminopyrimidine deaminase/5-amino-6-(5-phosphoribosylamino)uracil reductase RibD [Tepidiforma flava]WBL36583.1 bifunctional diaminohydroxyphosphoribosylaminopyrimidine deaminase/5-amino-6-(5-phosphoribosylamino)uracil reductase RibD [Tepidiforma flava]